MPCPNTVIDYVAVDVGGFADNALANGFVPGSAWLFVSNAPEEVGPGDATSDPPHWVFGDGPWNLCRAKVSGAGLPTKIRVFFWHISRFTVPTYWAIRVGSDGTGGAVSNIRQQLGTDNLTGDLGFIGRCLADAHLWDTLDLINSSEIDITSEQTIWSQTLPAGTQNPNLFSIVAAIVEFDLEPGATLTIRSAISLSPGKFGDYDAPLAKPNSNWQGHTGTHVRGLWYASELNLSFLNGLAYDCNPFLPPPKFVENDFCEDGGPEHLFFSEANSLWLTNCQPC